MRRRGRRRRAQSKVELNLAAMLDMAFQLLAFFILTFKPMPIEGQLSLKLPPPKPVTNVNANAPAGDDAKNLDPVAGISSLVITVLPDANGQIGSLAIGDGGVGNVAVLDDRLRTILADPGNPFEQVLLQIGPNLRYEELLKVIDVCTRQKMANGSALSKLSFVELATKP